MSEVLDRRSRNLRRDADLIYQAAIDHCGVDMDEVTHERIRDKIGIMRDIDTYHDQPGSSISGSMELLTDPESPYFERYPSLFPDQMEQDSYEEFLRLTRDILLLGKLASAATQLDEFIYYRQFEGQLIGDWFAVSATPYVRQQPAFTENLVPLMQSVAIAGNFFDSFFDAPRDFIKGELHVWPSPTFFQRVGALAIHHAIPALGIVQYPAVRKELALTAKFRLINKALYNHNGNLRLSMLEGLAPQR